MDSPKHEPAPTTETGLSPLEQFVEAYWIDREAGVVRPLAEYLRQFPGDDHAIAEEYLALERDEDEAIVSEFDAVPGLGLSLGAGPERIGPYRIVREIGRGGQGEVYLAEDSRLKRKVALKVLTTLGAVPEPLLGRFRREAEVASRLDDPGICTVFEAGNADGVPFIAMRYVVGETLAGKIQSAVEKGCVGALPLDSAGADEDAGDARTEVMRLVLLFERAARSLDHAHQAGIIHRDIKPGNIIVSPEGDPVLVDFGLARDEGSDQPTLTISGDLFGTPAYMSPEQLSGGRATVDARSDIYSLGVTLFECLVLERPFDGATREALFQNILTKPAPDPSRLNSDVPTDLGTVVRVALEKSRDHRYDSARELADDLRRVRLREPIRARPAGPLVRLRRWTERNPALASAVFGIFLVLAVGLTVSLLLLARTNSAFRSLAAKKQEADAARNALAWELDRSRGYQLAHESLNASRNDPALGLLLGIEAAARAPGEYADSALRTALAVLREKRTLVADFGAVAGLAFSADGGRLLAVAPHRASRLWEVESGGILRDEKGGRVFAPDGELAPAPAAFRIEGPPDGEPVLIGAGLRVPLRRAFVEAVVPDRVAWSRAAGRLALPLRDRRALLLDAGGGRVIRVIQPVGSGGGGADVPVQVTFDPTGRQLAVCGAHGVRLFDAATGRTTSTVDVNVVARPPLAWSPDGLLLAAAGPEHAVGVWDLAAHDKRVLLEGHRAEITAIAFSRDGARIASASRDHTARVWDARAGEAVAVLRGHRKPLTAIVFSPAAEHVATAGTDGSVRIWQARSGAAPRIASGNRLKAMLGARGTQVLLPGDAATGTALLVDAATGRLRLALRGHASTVRLARFGPNGERAVTYGEDRAVRVWSVANGAPLAAIPGVPRAPHRLCLSPDGRRLLTLSDRTAALWDTTGRRPAEPLANHAGFIGYAEFSPDGTHAATASDDGTARIWRVADAKMVAECRGHTDIVFPARFDPTGNRLLTASSDGTARIWDARSGRVVRVLARHRAAVTDARFDPAGARVLTISADGTARVWDATSGRRLHVLEHGDEDLIRGEFGPRGRLVATAAGGAIHLWNAETGRRLAVIARGDGGAPIQDLAFDADGSALVSIAQDGTLQRCVTDPLPEARRRRPRNLTETERGRYRVGPVEVRIEAE